MTLCMNKQTANGKGSGGYEQDDPLGIERRKNLSKLLVQFQTYNISTIILFSFFRCLDDTRTN